MEGIGIVRDDEWFYSSKDLRGGGNVSFWFRQDGAKLYVRDISIESDTFTIQCETLDDLPTFTEVMK